MSLRAACSILQRLRECICVLRQRAKSNGIGFLRGFRGQAGGRGCGCYSVLLRLLRCRSEPAWFDFLWCSYYCHMFVMTLFTAVIIPCHCVLL